MKRALCGLIAATVTASAAGCGTAPTAPSFPSITLRADQKSLGTLISASPATAIAKELAGITSSARDIAYTTIGPTGTPSAATGGVYVPAGTPPPGGWPVVAFGHGTTGVEPQCAPTLDPSMFQNLPIVVNVVRELRAAVVMPNYLGLGSAGRHPYLDSMSHGYDVLGAVRAARATDATLSNDIFLLGVSQGGRATEAAAELAPTAAPELGLRANAMVVPALSLQFPELIVRGQLNGAQYSILPQLVFGAQASDPGLRTSDVLHGTLLKNADALTQGCSGAAPKPWIDPSDPPIGAADARSDGTASNNDGTARFFDYLRRTELPQRPNPAITTLVINGADDELIPPRWTQSAVATMCRAGVPVEHRVRPGGHYAVSDLTDVTSWLGDRIARKPAPAACTAPAPARS
ncbi:Secretory lipase OS=Tsukamurella paurometabola (strain ATCC 8368 / DSM / CCUG 35730 / CIP 100753/ JCM 10117 / KCTC 9821 / NBRC 16120 / NCIMB 702349 / NCTC 13040) OX=521096 GN=Tpau_2597 PE=3 SV=1 [Tsukamurella paurometabola]|uniref:Secretory lipase n=1 Tax=Tsukamurella paurometabola (strain ATCC 8368 / DSM 20162 / CCUG 35730 / CIP 100753 / JCM 10117 / KCTC 9821 / NBRC 16120 / NCIMB 702349 / NCTC 13040) TaxID=521096 RepID=D5URZ5_TSUPD|nr:lipase family protein [Tsukamurella paurometabola]ADG79200.1 secretory lipase [Tsukamurella paurometabola DSM 20162]SUP34517.1 Secretory lipase [Tsukamurella paurometabola]